MTRLPTGGTPCYRVAWLEGTTPRHHDFQHETTALQWAENHTSALIYTIWLHTDEGDNAA